MDYIAGESAEAKAALMSNFLESFSQELKALQEACPTDNQQQLGDRVHKLLGMASIRKDPTLIEQLQQLSKLVKESAPEHELQQLFSHIEETLKKDQSLLP